MAALRRVWSVGRAVRFVWNGVRTGHGKRGNRKGIGHVLLENVWWAARTGTVNKDYFVFGLDRSGRSPDEALRLREGVVRFRRRGRLSGSAEIRALLSDKGLFSVRAAELGYPVPPVLAVLRGDGVTWCSPREEIGYDEFMVRARGIDAICKPVDGAQGKSIFRIVFAGDRAIVDGRPVPSSGLKERISVPSLLQVRIRQHPDLAELHPASVNTVRVVTVLSGARAEPFAAVLRIGVDGNPTDNWSRGGLAVGVDLENGRVVGPAIRNAERERELDHHPNTGVPLDGMRLPGFTHAVEMACRFHADIGGPFTVGWDIALTEDGPVFVEGNPELGLHSLAAVDPEFWERLLEIVPPDGDRSAKPPAVSTPLSTPRGG